MPEPPRSRDRADRRLPPPGVRAERYRAAHRDTIETCLDFRRTARVALAACDRFVASFELTDAAAALLLVLRREPGAAPARLAARIGVRRSSVATILKRIEREGWIERAIDARDRRRRVVRLSEPGRRRLDIMLGGYYWIARAQLAGLSAEDCARLRRLLARIRSNTPPPPRRGRPELDIAYDEPFDEWTDDAGGGGDGRATRPEVDHRKHPRPADVAGSESRNELGS
ncbi:MAG: MarR family transcriptional regulator [Gemmatimonadota bacterium]